jgi:hypothetical protein
MVDVGGCGYNPVDEDREAVQDHHYCHKSEYLLMRWLMLVDVVTILWMKTGKRFRIITTVTNQNTC